MKTSMETTSTTAKIPDYAKESSYVRVKTVGKTKIRIGYRDETWWSLKTGKRFGKQPGEAEARKAEKKKSDAEMFEAGTKLENFPELWLGLKPYEWQKKVLRDLELKETRVALKAANGSGKTSVCAAAAVLWHMLRFPESLVVCTAGVWRQVEDQLWPCLRKFVSGLGEGWTVHTSEIRHVNGSRAIGFSTSDPGKFEGWHRQGPTENLMMVLDEAKTIPDPIFEAVERCQPSRILMMSSPGGTQGAFYRAFTREAHMWQTFSVAASDCPHIPESWVKEQIEKWGEQHPLVRSMVYGEFMELGNESLVLPYNVLQNCVVNPPKELKGGKVAFCDFAAGGDENVLCVKEGNKIQPMVCWKERDTMSAVGRFIVEFKRKDLQAHEIYADSAGLGIPMCDALEDAGWTVNRVNNGERPRDREAYANRGSELWFTAARAVEMCEIVMPEDDLLFSQLTTRRCKTNSKGKLMLESKDEMRRRGLESPDRGDAFVGAVACGLDMQSFNRHVVRPSIVNEFGRFIDETTYSGLESGFRCE
jgi:hypothetical protein